MPSFDNSLKAALMRSGMPAANAQEVADGLPSPAQTVAVQALVSDVWALTGRSTTDGVLNSTNTVTSATAAFTQADVGSLFSVYSAASATLFYAGTIATVVNATTITINGTASPGSGSNATICIGKNAQPAIQALLNAAANTTKLQSGLVEIPGGIFMLAQGITIPDGVVLRGQHAGSAFNIDLSRIGTVLVPAVTIGGAGYPTTFVVQVGVNTAYSNIMGAKLENCSVSGGAFVQDVVLHRGCEAQLVANRIWGGVSTGIFSDCKLGRILNNRVSQQTRGYPLDAQYTNGGDALIQGNWLNGGAGTLGAPKANVRIKVVSGGSGNLRFFDNHLWQESPVNVNTPAVCLLIEVPNAALMAGIQVRGNTFDNVYGHYVVVDVQGSGQLYSSYVSNNFFLVNDTAFPNATFDAVRLQSAAGSLVLGFQVNENTSVNLSGTNSFINGFNPILLGTTANIQSNENNWRNAANIVPANTVLSGGCNNNSRSNSSNVVAYSSSRGRSTQTGNTAATVFNIAHGMADTPVAFAVTPRVALVLPAFVVTADGTNLIVTYANAPPATANNVDLQWIASL